VKNTSLFSVMLTRLTLFIILTNNLLNDYSIIITDKGKVA
jgi:hypothetical protein